MSSTGGSNANAFSPGGYQQHATINNATAAAVINPHMNAATGNTAGSILSGGTGNTSSSATDDLSRPVQYICGDCDAKVILKRGDIIRCRSCGHRVLYKERTTRMVQFEAR